MDRLKAASKELENAQANYERLFADEIAKLDKKESDLTTRLQDLNQKKRDAAKSHGSEDALDEDIVEINAGGKLISAKRSTLTQLKGTRLEALFSGRYDQKSRRDADGRIFLDVNPVCFQAIVDYLNELAITPDGVSTSPPTVEADLGHILNHQLELFGLNEKFGSAIIKDGDNIAQLREWISKAGSGSCGLGLLFSSSDDGKSVANFHSKCDNKGPTLTIIETTEGHIVGGYSSAPWTSSRSLSSSNGAFLFHLSGSQLLKSDLTGGYNSNAIYCQSSYGPTFGGGYDLRVCNPFVVSSNVGFSYQKSSSWPLSEGVSFQVKDMEVFQITSTSVSANESSATSKASPVSKVDSF
mmetsp:Transcript_31410/g.74992  ORF Transcript_31410/g.74992 Transcript_31410/m.74992 type:complete len:355 (+) Transcript_31410:77-1141(+)